MDSGATVKVAVNGDVGTIVIDRAEKRNAMNRETRTGLKAAMDAMRNRCRVVVLTGAADSFCAGIDLKERVADQKEGRDTAVQEWTELNLEIRQHPSIFIAAVNGLALGGGATLINVCDLAVAAETAEIGMPELGLAIYPGLAGPSTQLSISRKRAAQMILTTERIDGRTAAEWGLVNKAVPAASLMDEAGALAARIAAFDPVALTASKQAIDRIPATITDWRQAFAYGELTNAWIRGRTSAQGESLQRFSARKVGRS